jgi:hypothetical protein
MPATSRAVVVFFATNLLRCVRKLSFLAAALCGLTLQFCCFIGAVAVIDEQAD